MLKVITAVEERPTDGFKVFLAGGITNCPNWQKEIIDKMKEEDIGEAEVYLFNPRRENFPINDPNASKEQIEWEFEALRDADMIIFWFSRGSLNPIVLYELGMWGNSRDIPIVIGIDEGYERRQDVEIQTELAREDAPIVDTLGEVVAMITETVNDVW